MANEECKVSSSVWEMKGRGKDSDNEKAVKEEKILVDEKDSQRYGEKKRKGFKQVV